MSLPVLPSPTIPKAALLSIVRAISGVQAFWTTDKRAHAGQRPGTEMAWLLVSMSAYLEVGVAELRTALDPVTNNLDSVIVGQRQFTTTIRAHSLDANLEAFDLLERVRFRIRTATAKTLFPATLSLRDIQPMHILNDVVVEQRVMRVATIDVRWNLAVVADPLEQGGGGWIATVDEGGIIPGTTQT